MYLSNLGITERYKIGWPVLVILGGIICGLFILFLSLLPTKWGVLGAIGIMVPFVAVLTGDVKRFFLAMLVFTFPIPMIG